MIDIATPPCFNALAELFEDEHIKDKFMSIYNGQIKRKVSRRYKSSPRADDNGMVRSTSRELAAGLIVKDLLKALVEAKKEDNNQGVLYSYGLNLLKDKNCVISLPQPGIAAFNMMTMYKEFGFDMFKAAGLGEMVKGMRESAESQEGIRPKSIGRTGLLGEIVQQRLAI